MPVGADWINREPLLGYVNALEPLEYVIPESGALNLIIEANKTENAKRPYFLILDEMNLSHVERYFADFLSVMESNDTFKLHNSDSNLDSKGIAVEKEYKWPTNLFIIGTVNIDETTYMFSPKVLDRANVIEFRIDIEDMKRYLSDPKEVKELKGEGANQGELFVDLAQKSEKTKSKEVTTALTSFFENLQRIGAEFGYRTASEIQILFAKIDLVNKEYKEKKNEKIDFAIMQKLLPKLHGSRNKLSPVLKKLACLCYKKGSEFNDETEKRIFEKSTELEPSLIYKLSLEKITRMHRNVIENGFTSYAEA